MPDKKHICPECKALDIVDIVYGYPTQETLQSWFKKEIELGGCIIGKHNPSHKCKKCEHQW
jgi:Zn ribbon nucleic-acid-binding protein